MELQNSIPCLTKSSQLDPLRSHMNLVHHTNCANDQTHQILYLRTLRAQYSLWRCRINARCVSLSSNYC